MMVWLYALVLCPTLGPITAHNLLACTVQIAGASASWALCVPRVIIILTLLDNFMPSCEPPAG